MDARSCRINPRPPGRCGVSLALTECILCLLAGCHTVPSATPCVDYVPRAGNTRPADPGDWTHIPPAPAVASPVQAPAPAVAAPGLAGPQLSGPAAPASVAVPLTQPMPAAALAPCETAAPPPAPQTIPPELEQRLAALEQEHRARLTELSELQTRDAEQTQLLQRVAATMTAAHSEVSQLQQTVRTQHQQDVQSLRQLSQTLSDLLQAKPSDDAEELD